MPQRTLVKSSANDDAGTYVPRRKDARPSSATRNASAEAWRFVNPKSKSNDNSAAELTRRELQWYERNKEDISRRFGRFADVSASSPEPFQARSDDGCTATPMTKCAGLADRPCRKKMLPRRKRCATCSKENRRRQKQGYNQVYFQANREALNEKRRERRRKARQQAVVDAIFECLRAEAKRRAALPRLIGKPGRTAPLVLPYNRKDGVPVIKIVRLY